MVLVERRPHNVLRKFNGTIICLNKATYSEAHSILYAKNHFAFENPSVFLRFVETFGSARALLTHITVDAFTYGSDLGLTGCPRIQRVHLEGRSIYFDHVSLHDKTWRRLVGTVRDGVLSHLALGRASCICQGTDFCKCIGPLRRDQLYDRVVLGINFRASSWPQGQTVMGEQAPEDLPQLKRDVLGTWQQKIEEARAKAVADSQI